MGQLQSLILFERISMESTLAGSAAPTGACRPRLRETGGWHHRLMSDVPPGQISDLATGKTPISRGGRRIRERRDNHFQAEKVQTARRFSLTHLGTRLFYSFRYHADSGGSPECSSLRAHGRAGFISQLIGSDFVVYRRVEER